MVVIRVLNRFKIFRWIVYKAVHISYIKKSQLHFETFPCLTFYIVSMKGKLYENLNTLHNYDMFMIDIGYT